MLYISKLLNAGGSEAVAFVSPAVDTQFQVRLSNAVTGNTSLVGDAGNGGALPLVSINILN